MAGTLPHPRRATARAAWPRELHHAALVLGAAGVVYWLSFLFDGSTLWIPGVGILHLGLFAAWVAVVLNVGAWPSLWAGLRELKARHPGNRSPVIAFRAFVLTIVLALAGIVLLPLEYHTVASTQAWLLVLYVSAFPFLGWTFVPILALHGIVFARVANLLAPRYRVMAQAGALCLFAVAAVTVAVILQNPDATIFIRTWSVGLGILPAIAAAGYVLVASAMTMHALPQPKPTRGWGAAITPVRRTG